MDLAVPLALGSADGDPRIITTLTSFATVLHVRLAELQLETLLPIEKGSGEVVRRRWG